MDMRGRRRFDDDYSAVKEICNNKKGYRIRYVYSGPWFSWDAERRTVRGRKLALAGLCAADLALFILCAVQRTSGNLSQFTTVAVALAAVGLVFELWGLALFCAAGERVTRDTFRDVERELKVAPMFRAVMLLAAAALGVWFLFADGFSVKALAVTAGYVACAALSYCVRRVYAGLPHMEEENEAQYQ